MLKKIAALGLASVLSLAPVVAFAEDPPPADAAAGAPGTTGGGVAKPMKHHSMKHHMMKHHSMKHHSMKKKMMKSDAAAPADAGSPTPASTDAPK